MKSITGVGENDHVTANDFRKLFAGVFGPGNYILDTGEKFVTTLISNNELHIGTGVMCCNGHLSAEVEGANIAIANGTQGMKRTDLIVRRYTRNNVSKIEKDEWVYLAGEPDASNPNVPEYTTGDILSGDLIVDCPVIKITLNGLNVEKVECLLTVMKSMVGVFNHTEELRGDILNLGRSKKIDIKPYTGSSDYDINIEENKSYYYPGLGIAVINARIKQTYKKASSVNYEELSKFGLVGLKELPDMSKVPVTVVMGGNYTRRYSGIMDDTGLISARTNTSYSPTKGSVYNYFVSAVYTIKKEG